MKTLIILFFVLISSACATDGIERKSTNNPDVFVTRIADFEGCRIYRFRDVNAHYFVKCDGSNDTTTLSMINCGKNCFRQESIQQVTH